MSNLNINTRIKLNNGIKIPLFGLGTYQNTNPKDAFDAVLYALKIGYRLIDTAAYYRNEEYIGKAIKESKISRKDIFVTTKLWITDHDDPEKAFYKSLEKLNLDYIDLYLIHWPVENVRNRTWKILEKINEEGKCKCIGVSNYTIRHLKELMKIAKIVPAVNQVEFSPFLYQKELLGFCNENKIALEAYSPLTKGKRLDYSRLIKIADKYNKTTAQILIKWCLQHNIITIPKSSSKERIKENADVFDFEIKKEDINFLDKLNENYRTSWDPSEIP